MKAVRMAMLGLGSVLVAYLVTVYLLDAIAQKRNRYLIPEGYAGWLCVTYKVPGTPELEMEDGFRVVKFTERGEVITATEPMPGQHKDEFYYYSGDKRRKINPSREIGGGYSISSDKADGGYTFKFWVSRDARGDYPLFVKEKSNYCGPVSGAST